MPDQEDGDDDATVVLPDLSPTTPGSTTSSISPGSATSSLSSRALADWDEDWRREFQKEANRLVSEKLWETGSLRQGKMVRAVLDWGVLRKNRPQDYTKFEPRMVARKMFAVSREF